MKINQVSREKMQERFPDHEDAEKLRAERDAALARIKSLEQDMKAQNVLIRDYRKGLVAQSEVLHGQTNRIGELEEETEHLRHELELPIRVANSDSAVMQLAEARERIAELQTALTEEQAKGAENARLRACFDKWEREVGQKRCLCCDDRCDEADCTCSESNWVPAWDLRAALASPPIENS